MRSALIAVVLSAGAGPALAATIPFDFAHPLPRSISREEGGKWGWVTYQPYELQISHLLGNSPAFRSPRPIPTDSVFDSAYLYLGSASGLWVVTYDPATFQVTRAAMAKPVETVYTSGNGNQDFWTRYDLSPFQIGRGGLWEGNLAILLGDGSVGMVGYSYEFGGWMPFLYGGTGTMFSSGATFDELDFDPVGSRLVNTPYSEGVPAPGYFWEPSYLGPFVGFSYDTPWRTRGDANVDGSVDLADFGLLKTAWGGQGAPWSGADFTGDGAVDETDLRVLTANFGWRAPSVVPEPASWLLAVSGVVLVSLWRRRHARPLGPT